MTRAQEQRVDALEESLGRALVRALVERQGMNDLLHDFLDAIGGALGVSRLVLYDYDERADVFELLCFRGYPAGSRSDLNRWLAQLDVRRACRERAPYRAGDQRLLIPLYFQEPLEALLLVEGIAPEPEPPAGLPAARLVSRFLGLFLSSNRLPINQRRDLASVSDLERAREVQLAYLPSEYPVTEKYEIYGYNQSSALVGGDYFDYFCRRNGAIECVVADACGHGLAAALIMSTFRGLLHSEVAGGDFATLFTRLNHEVFSGGELLQYLTAVFFEYDEERAALRYFNAGHFDPLVVHTDGSATRLEGGGPPLGMFRGSSYEPRSSPVEPGDLLVLFTDGLVELRNDRDEFFGIDRVTQAVVAHRRLALRELARDVLGGAATFTGALPPDDDLTLFLMRFR